jgi:hypothetical protein
MAARQKFDEDSGTVGCGWCARPGSRSRRWPANDLRRDMTGTNKVMRSLIGEPANPLLRESFE